MHLNEAASEMAAAMHLAGIIPLEDVTHRLAASIGTFVRFRCEGDRRGRRNGYAILFPDGEGGTFGNWATQVRGSWRSRGHKTVWEPKDVRAITNRRAAREAGRVRERETVATLAMQEWSSASTANPAHAYLKAKELTSFGIRQYGNVLLIPMWDARFRLRNVQRIAPDGAKRFMQGGQTNGLFWHHGVLTMGNQLTTFPMVIAEGFATAAAIHEATGYAVVAAMSGNNLEAVAVVMRQRFASRESSVPVRHPHSRAFGGLQRRFCGYFPD